MATTLICTWSFKGTDKRLGQLIAPPTKGVSKLDFPLMENLH